MSRRQHHTRPARPELHLTAGALTALDALEVETRARAAYDVAELQAVTELNANLAGGPRISPVPWSDADVDTRRDYRALTIKRMYEAGELRVHEDGETL